MKMVPIGSWGVALFERIRTYGLVGIDVALLEEVRHWRMGLEVLEAHARHSVTLSSCCLLVSM